jgi:hypothetical protein
MISLIRSGRARMSIRSAIFLQEFGEVGNNFVALKTSQALQTQFKNRLCLGFGKQIAAFLDKTILQRQALPGVSHRALARCSISATVVDIHNFDIRPRRLHRTGVGDALIRAMISSTLSSATAKPS